MNIDELTIGQLKQLQALLPTATSQAANDRHWKVGQAYYIRTVTHHLVGRLEAVTPQELVISGAAWVADSGRWHKALADGELSEVEPFPDGEVIVGRGGLIDAVPWNHPLQRSAR